MGHLVRAKKYTDLYRSMHDEFDFDFSPIHLHGTKDFSIDSIPIFNNLKDSAKLGRLTLHLKGFTDGFTFMEWAENTSSLDRRSWEKKSGVGDHFLKNVEEENVSEATTFPVVSDEPVPISSDEYWDGDEPTFRLKFDPRAPLPTASGFSEAPSYFCYVCDRWVRAGGDDHMKSKSHRKSARTLVTPKSYPLKYSAWSNLFDSSWVSSPPFSVLPSLNSSAKVQGRPRPWKFPIECVRIVDNDKDLIVLCEELQTSALNSSSHLFVGFDTEWRLSSPNQHGVAVMQICLSLDRIVVVPIWRIFDERGCFPESLLKLLAGFVLVGINIEEDLKLIASSFSLSFVPLSSHHSLGDNGLLESSSNSLVFLELDHLASLVFGSRSKTGGSWGLRGLFEILYPGLTISKDFALRTSDWSRRILSERQLIYAATDAAASLLVFDRLVQLCFEMFDGFRISDYCRVFPFKKK